MERNKTNKKKTFCRSAFFSVGNAVGKSKRLVSGAFSSKGTKVAMTSRDEESGQVGGVHERVGGLATHLKEKTAYITARIKEQAGAMSKAFQAGYTESDLIKMNKEMETCEKKAVKKIDRCVLLSENSEIRRLIPMALRGKRFDGLISEFESEINKIDKEIDFGEL